MEKANITYEFIKKVVYDHPNNYNLGEVIRKIIMDIKDNNDGDKKTESTQLPK